MKQALHIFRKDVRHLRLELTGSLALLLLFCVTTPQTWTGAQGGNSIISSVAKLLTVLLPLMWLMLIARAVQEERLVGSQQFWVTRPYAWGSLLGGKALFVVVWVVLPFLLTQWMVLLEAGLRPWSDVWGMLASMLSGTVVVWLLFFAFAAVTVDVPRAFLAVLVVLLVWAAMLTAFSRKAGTSAPFTGMMMLTVTGALVAGCVIFAYRTRKTKDALCLLGGSIVMVLALLGCLEGVYFSGVTNALIRWHYPVQASSSVRLAMHPELGRDRGTDQQHSPDGEEVTVHLPLLIEGLQPGQHVHDPKAQLTLDAEGYHYASRWLQAVPYDDGISFDLPAAVYAHMRSSAVHVHVSLAAELLEVAETQEIVARPEFRAPGGGNCILAGDRMGNNLVCRYAYRSPRPTWVTAMVTAGKCGSGVPQHISGGGSMERPAGVNPDPVVEEEFSLGGEVCPGAPVTFRVSKPTENVRLEADLRAVMLAPYVLH